MLEMTIHTTRIIADDDYNQWVQDMQISGIPVDGVALMISKEFHWVSPHPGGNSREAHTIIKMRRVS